MVKFLLYRGLNQIICLELVGNYLLYEQSKLYEKKDIGLYRDDGLPVFKNKSGPESGKIKKSIQAIGIPGERVENNHPV